MAEVAHGRRHFTRNAAQPGAGKIIPPLAGALLKNEQDVHLFERLVS